MPLRERPPSESTSAVPNVSARSVASRLQGAGENPGLGVLEIACQPGGRTRAGDGLPGAAAIGRLEDTGRELLRAVAEDEAGFGIEELDLIEPRQRVAEQPLPGFAAILGEQQNPRAPPAMRQLFSSDNPAGGLADERNRAQRGPQAGGLALPGLAAVDGVQDHAFVADRPALLAVDELKGPQRGIFEVAQIGCQGRLGRREKGNHDEERCIEKTPAAN